MSQLLTEATVQEIQLELIRHTQFNAFDGKKVVARPCAIAPCGLQR